jgi:hypothetical protein
MGFESWPKAVSIDEGGNIRVAIDYDFVHTVADLHSFDISGNYLCGQFFITWGDYKARTITSNNGVHFVTYRSGWGDLYAVVAYNDDCERVWNTYLRLSGPSEVIGAANLGFNTIIVGNVDVRGDSDIHLATYRAWPSFIEPDGFAAFDLSGGDDVAAAVCSNGEDAAAVVGKTEVIGSFDVLVGLTQTYGGIEWWRTYGAPYGGADSGIDVDLLPTGQVVVLAELEGGDGPMMGLLLYGEDGQLLDAVTNPLMVTPVGVDVTSTGEIYCVGHNPADAPTAAGDIVICKYSVAPGVGIRAEDAGSVRFVVKIVEHRPSDGSVRIRWEQPSAADVKVAVYDVSGRMINTLTSGPQASGEHELTWNGRSDGGESVASGVYFVRFDVGNRVERRRVVLVR